MTHIIGYNVYLAPEGSAESFVGFADTIEKARTMTGHGLEESLYETAGKVGHCAGMVAPDKSREDEEPTEWFGPDGWHCAVAVFESQQ